MASSLHRIAMVRATASLALLPGRAATQQSEGIGGCIDDPVMTAKTKVAIQSSTAAHPTRF